MAAGAWKGPGRRPLPLFALVALLLAACGGETGANGEPVTGERVQGTVTTESGEPVSGSTIKLFMGEGEPTESADDETTTDAQGGFEFGGLEGGLYFVAVEVNSPSGGSCVIAHLFEVKEGTVAKADIVLPSDATFPPIAAGQIGFTISGDTLYC